MVYALFPASQPKQLRQLLLVQFRADDAEAAGVVGAAGPDLVLLGHIVELHPGAAGPVDDALGPEDLAVLPGVQGGEDPLDVRLGEGLGGLPAPGGEHLVGVVMVVVFVAGAVGVITLVAVVFAPVMVMIVVMPMLTVIMALVMTVMVLMLLMVVIVVVFVFLLLASCSARIFSSSSSARDTFSMAERMVFPSSWSQGVVTLS